MKLLKKNTIRIGKIQRLILLMSLYGVALGSAYTLGRQKKIYEGVKREIANFRNDHIKRASESLFRAHLMRKVENKDGTTTLELTGKGKEFALTFDLENIKLSRLKKWDGKWRIVSYDIPVHMNKIRRSVAYHIKNAGMRELQNSMFIYPYPCHQEIRYIIEFYNAWKYVRFVVADFIDNEKELKKIFSLS